MNKQTIKIIIALGLLILAILFFSPIIKNKNTASDYQPMNATGLEPSDLSDVPTGYPINKENSTVNWTAKKTIITDWIDKGTINIERGRIDFDKDNNIVSGEIIIDMSTISARETGSGTNQDRLTNHLKSADFFDVAMYPTSKIVVTSVNGNQVTGDVTIKGVTKSITFPVSVSKSGDAYIVNGSMSINRADFGVKYGSRSFFKDLADRAIIDDIFTIDFSITTR